MDSCMIRCMNVHLSEKILLLNNFGLAQWFDLNLLQSSQSHVSRKQSFSVVAPPQLIEFSADGFWASPIFLSLRARLSLVALWTRVQFGLTKVWKEWVTSELPFPLCQNESSRETIHMETSSAYRFIFIQIKLIFISKVLARRLVLKQRQQATRKWPIIKTNNRLQGWYYVKNVSRHQHDKNR